MLGHLSITWVARQDYFSAVISKSLESLAVVDCGDWLVWNVEQGIMDRTR